MKPVTLDPCMLHNLFGKTVLVTGAADGIGAEIVRLLVSSGANVVVADLEYARGAAETLIASTSAPLHASFVLTNILDWSQKSTNFKQAKSRFGSIEALMRESWKVGWHWT
jgi:NAD(P)-dependent dehydrogenase (short-subunit alcohol dehydrogenase family)